MFVAIAELGSVEQLLAQSDKECRAISDATARLACYDKNFPPANAAADGKLVAGSELDKTKTTFEYNWAGVAGCRTLAKSPAFQFFNLPPDARSVAMALTQGDREFGGEELVLPASGIIPAGSIIMRGPCVPGSYRWTATIKSANGKILVRTSTDRWFSTN